MGQRNFKALFCTISLILLAYSRVGLSEDRKKYSQDLITVETDQKVLISEIVNPQLEKFVSILHKLYPTKKIHITLVNAIELPGHKLHKPKRSILIDVVTEKQKTTFEEFPFPLATKAGEVYNVDDVQNSFFYPLCIAVQMVIQQDPNLENPVAVRHLFEQIKVGYSSLSEALRNNEFPEALNFTFPPHLNYLGELLDSTQFDCAAELVGRRVPNTTTQAVYVNLARGKFLEIANAASEWK